MWMTGASCWIISGKSWPMGCGARWAGNGNALRGGQPPPGRHQSAEGPGAGGYAIPRNEDGHVVRSIREAHPGDKLELRMADGSIDCKVL